MKEKSDVNLKQIDEYRWEIPRSGKMLVSGMIYADAKMVSQLQRDPCLQQVANVAQLPGVLNHSFAMPDMHWGYGFPIGGVAAMSIEDGVISPGGVGYDINCGCRLIRTELSLSDVQPRLKETVDALFQHVPAGVGSTGKVSLSRSDAKKVCMEGSRWAVSQGYGWEEDLEHTEDRGAIAGGNPELISQRAWERGKNQLGTLGSGNHFLEIDVVEEIYDERVANVFGLFKDQVTILIHSGSRGFGYQVCDDSLKSMVSTINKLGFSLPDRQLACAPINSPQGKKYYQAMICAANYAWTNRQILMHWTRETFEQIFRSSAEKLGMHLVYDVAHNIAKKEVHCLRGKERQVCVHRKGATRAFPAGHDALPSIYREVGQPVLIPGDMGRNSFVLVGTEKAMEESFGSTCHGAGRLMSRQAAKKSCKGRSIAREMADKGIYTRHTGKWTMAEEIPEAYKNVQDVVHVVHNAGISKKVAKLRPLGVVKG